MTGGRRAICWCAISTTPSIGHWAPMYPPALHNLHVKRRGSLGSLSLELTRANLDLHLFQSGQYRSWQRLVVALAEKKQ